MTVPLEVVRDSAASKPEPSSCQTYQQQGIRRRKSQRTASLSLSLDSADFNRFVEIHRHEQVSNTSNYRRERTWISTLELEPPAAGDILGAVVTATRYDARFHSSGVVSDYISLALFIR